MSEKIAFIADSCADLPEEIRKRENVFILPVIVSCRGKEYLDGEEIFAETIYQNQKEGEVPSTSLPTGEMVEKILTSVIQNGYEKAVIFTMSSAISGTWNLCRLLCEECSHLECIVFDSGMASLAEGALLVEIMEEVERGELEWRDMESRLQQLKKNTHAYFGIDTLEFLQKNGRIGKATAFAGNLLNIMPVLSFDENGVITPVEKVRGKRKRLNRLKEIALEHIGEHKKYRLYFVDGGCPEMADTLKKEIIDASGKARVLTSELGCALAAHLGKNLVGVCVQIIEE